MLQEVAMVDVAILSCEITNKGELIDEVKASPDIRQS